MKRRIITSVTVCVFLALVLAVRLSDREKTTIVFHPKKPWLRIFWKRVSNMRQSSCGHRTETVSAAEPDVMPSGIWADVWNLDADTTILVFYDAENDDKVERAALGQKGE